MKKITTAFLFSASILIASCGGGMTPEEKEKLKQDSAAAINEIDALMKKASHAVTDSTTSSDSVTK
jgi:hypothetical protein